MNKPTGTPDAPRDVAKCGNGVVAGGHLVGCDRPFTSEREIFRCYDCDVPFHRECLKRHCKEGFRFPDTHPIDQAGG
jgi:hypothetical protein